MTMETSLRGEKSESRFTATYYLKCTQNFSNYVKKQGSMINIQSGGNHSQYKLSLIIARFGI